ncbi:MAG TPA: PAS domain S-box protein, partial [Armatimonadota bacterium]
RAEEALRESEARYHAFSEASTEAIVMHEHGIILEVNQALLDHLGYTKEEMVGRLVLDFTAPESREEMSRRIQTSDAGPYIAVSLHKDGSKTIGEIRARDFIYWGRPVRLVAMRDVTELKRAEDALRESEALFRSLAENANAVIGIVQGTKFVYVNTYFLRLSGYPREELLGLDISQLVSPKFREMVMERAQMRQSGELTIPTEYEFEVIAKDGSVRWVDFSAALTEYRGKPAIIAIAYDVTARKQAEEERERLLAEIARRAAELDSTLDAIADGLIFYSPTLQVIRENAAAIAIFGLAQEEYALPLTERLRRTQVAHADGTPMTVEETLAWRAAHGETIRELIEVVHTPDGRTVWVSGSGAPVYTPDGTLIGAITTFTDITRLRQLQEQQQVLLQSVSHDLRTPLSVINGYAKLMQNAIEEKELNGVMRQGLGAIQRGIQRMDVMIQDLVDATRQEGGQLHLELQPVLLQAYLPDFIQRTGTAMGTDRVHLEIPDDLSPVLADYNRLDRIATNLLSNALKYSDPDTPVLVRARRTDGEVEISVTDQGKGIAPEDLPHLFERFYRAEMEPRAEGIGLGLYITRALVEAHGGRIWAESALDKGSTFYFTLLVA